MYGIFTRLCCPVIVLSWPHIFFMARWYFAFHTSFVNVTVCSTIAAVFCRLGGEEKVTPTLATGKRWEQEQRWRNIFFANGGAAPEGRGVKLGTHGVKVRTTVWAYGCAWVSVCVFVCVWRKL